MELKEFIRTALVEVAEAVSEGQAAIESTGVIINPAMVITANSANAGVPLHNPHSRSVHDRYPIQMCEFDVAVTVAESADIDAGAKISVLGASIGAGGATSSGSTSISRVKFKVPLIFRLPS